jgi:hypothetical protein
MQIARSGLTADTVTELGGIKATLEWLSRWVLPAGDDVLFISRAGAEMQNAIAMIMPSEEPFFFDVSVFTPDGQFSTTEKPVASESKKLSDGSYLNGLRATVMHDFPVPPSEWSFKMGHRYQIIDDCAFLAELIEVPPVGKAPLPASYEAMILALKDCISEFSPEKYQRARRAMKICLAQIDKWPSDPAMMATFARIASDNRAMKLGARVDQLARERVEVHA